MVGLYEYFSRGISVEGAFGVCLLSLFCPQGYKALYCVQKQMWYGSLRLISGLACSVYFTAWLSMVVLYKHFSIDRSVVVAFWGCILSLFFPQGHRVLYCVQNQVWYGSLRLNSGLEFSVYWTAWLSIVGLFEHFSRGLSVGGAFGVCLLLLFCPQRYSVLYSVQNQVWYGSLWLNSGIAFSVYFTTRLSMVGLYEHFSTDLSVVGAFWVILLSLFYPQGYRVLYCVQNQVWYGSLTLNSGLVYSVCETAWLSMVGLYEHLSRDL